jgi:DNA-binding transcriptional LysR family regulator
LTSLEVFHRVAETGGFSAAARRLGMSGTAISKHIQALEDRLGVRLVNRTTRKVSLTEAGCAYHERAAQILADLEEADRVAGALNATPRGTLRLHTSVSIARFLAPVASEYLTLYPDVSPDLTVGDRIGDLIEEGYDLAITVLPLPDSGAIVRRLTPWRHVLCCAPSYLATHPAPQELADLTQHNCLRFAFYPFGNDWQRGGAAPDDARRRRHHVGRDIPRCGGTRGGHARPAAAGPPPRRALHQRDLSAPAPSLAEGAMLHRSRGGALRWPPQVAGARGY